MPLLAYAFHGALLPYMKKYLYTYIFADLDWTCSNSCKLVFLNLLSINIIRKCSPMIIIYYPNLKSRDEYVGKKNGICCL